MVMMSPATRGHGGNLRRMGALTLKVETPH